MRKGRMVVFRGEQDICGSKKMPELAKFFLTFLGVPLRKCPIGNTTQCYNEKNKKSITAVHKLINFYANSVLIVDAKIKHDSVNNSKFFLVIFLYNFFNFQGESCMKIVGELYNV